MVRNYLSIRTGCLFFDMNNQLQVQRDAGRDHYRGEPGGGSFIWENYYDPEEQLNQYDLTLYIRDETTGIPVFEETHYPEGYALERVLELLRRRE